MFSKILLFAPVEINLLNDFLQKVSLYDSKFVRIIVPKIMANRDDFMQLFDHYEKRTTIDEFPETEMNSLKILLSSKDSILLDITYASPVYAFKIHELCGNNVTVRYKGRDINADVPVAVSSLPGINTKTKIIAYLRDHPNSSPKMVTEGIFDTPSSNDYNTIRVAMIRLVNDRDHVLTKKGRWYTLRDCHN